MRALVNSAAQNRRPPPFVITAFSGADDLNPIIAAWARAFVEPPNGPRQLEDLRAQLSRHLACPEFHGFVACDATDGATLGVVYGYATTPGEWWRDRVAQAMTPEQVTAILDRGFCLSELGVTPEARRRGIAAALVTRLLAAQPFPFALLSTRSDNDAGLAFYRATEWSVLLPRMSFGWNFPPYDILLRRVAKDHTSR